MKLIDLVRKRSLSAKVGYARRVFQREAIEAIKHLPKPRKQVYIRLRHKSLNEWEVILRRPGRHKVHYIYESRQTALARAQVLLRRYNAVAIH